MLYYNLRLTKTRGQSFTIEKYLNENGVDYRAITAELPKEVGFFYDCQELIVFSLLQFLSIIPTLVAWKFGS
jgi:hypothetical protein